MSQSQPLSGRVAVVTGASSGIGKEIALTLGIAGAKVGLGARRLELLQDVVKTIKDGGGDAIAVKTDVVNRQEVKNLVAETEKALGPVDILVNNAGIWAYTLMKNLHEDEWERMIDVNCKGVMNGIGAVLDGMVKRGNGHIVNISSDAGRKSIIGLGPYSGTKYFVEGVSRTLRQEVANYGIRVTCIQPGKVEMSWKPRMDQEVADIFGAEPINFDILKPEDVARAVLYALSQPKHMAINEVLLHPSQMPF